jgi:hypothetical protein
MTDPYRTQCSEYELPEAMTRFGGSFVQQLALLIRLADESNKRKLWTTFPEYIKQYEELALKTREVAHGAR